MDREPDMTRFLDGFQLNASALIQVAKHVMGYGDSEDASDHIAYVPLNAQR